MALVKKTRVLELPGSHTKVTVRELKPYDYAHLGSIPDTFAEAAEKVKAAQAQGAKPEDALKIEDLDPAQVDYIARACCRAVVKVHQDPPVSLVPKQSQDCMAHEFSFYDLDADDCNELVLQVFQGRGQAEVPANFPEAQGGSGEPLPDGADLRETTQ